MKKILLFLLAALAALCGCGTESDVKIDMDSDADINTGVSVETPADTAVYVSQAAGGDIPVLRFSAASDVHIKEYDSVERTRFADLFGDTYAYCETQVYKKLDAVVIIGDFTDNGTAAQYDAFNEVARANIREETQLIVFMGNHEWGSGDERVFTEKTGMEPNSDSVIKGFHFIGVSPVGSDYSSRFDRLGRRLKAAAEEDPARPIFTFQHHHIKDTVYVSEEWYTGQLDDIYRDYPQSVNFSGHSHGPVNNPRSIYQKDYTLLGTGTLSYFECLSGMSYGSVPPDANRAAQFIIVEVYADNSVKLMPFNLLTHDFFRDPGSRTRDNLVWYIDKPSDKLAFYYTDARYESADKPRFPDGAAGASIDEIDEKTARITFSQAEDGECVYSYEIALYAAGAKTPSSTYSIFSGYYFEPMPQSLSHTMGGLRQNTDYTVKITAVDCYGKRSDNVISGAFKTKKGVPFRVNTGSGGTFAGTFTDFEGYGRFIAGSNPVYGGGEGVYWVGAWDSGSVIPGSGPKIAEGRGYNGSKALALWEDGKENQGLYLCANDANNNLNSFPGAKYLRVRMDLSALDFRKANFGAFDYDGNLFTMSGLYFWYLPDEDESDSDGKWRRYEHGGDGCFGSGQDSSVAGFRGWFAFPVSDFAIRQNANPDAGESCDLSEVRGVYMFRDYDDAVEPGTVFCLDEIAFVDDYTVFEKYYFFYNGDLFMNLTRPAAAIIAAAMITSFIACSQSAEPDKPDTTAEAAAEADGAVKLPYADLVPGNNFGGYTFTFANDPLSVEYYSAIDIAQLTGETLDDAIYERNRRVEDKYNIVIDALNTGAPDLIRATVTAGSGDIDVGYVLQQSVMGLISGGYLRPVTSLPVIDMTKPYWDQGAQDMLMINGDMFHGYLDISFDHYESMATIFYNGKMLEDYNLGDPYELFNGGIWTMERMYNMMTTVSGDVNGDGKVTVADDRLGFVGREFEYLPNLYASDAMLAEIVAGGDDIRLVSNLATERIIAIGEFANKLYTDKTISVIARDDATRNMFKEGRALFFSRLLGDFRNLRDKEDDYGLILYPSYEENTENIRVYIQNAFAMVIPVDIIEEDIAGTILQALAADCYDNVMDIYFEKAVIAKGTRDANSESMLRYMREHRAFDICYTFGLSPLLSAYTAAVSNKNFASVAEKYAKSVNIAMEKAISDYLEAIQTSG